MEKAIKKEQARRAKIRPQIESESEQFKKLSDMKNIARVIAETEIKLYGYYAAKIDGKKTFVTA